MTYQDIILLLKKAVLESRVANSFYYDSVSVIDREGNIDYPAVIYTPNTAQPDSQNNRIDIFDGTLTYLDRLPEARKKLGIHSVAYSVLRDIINRFRDYNNNLDEDGGIYTVTQGSTTFYTSEQNFADGLSGAWSRLTMEIDGGIDECYFTDENICE